MKIRAKKGFELNIDISGHRNEPIIVISPFAFGGRNHPGGSAKIQHWENKGLDRGLFLARPRAYIQIVDMTPIDEAVEMLPEKKKYIHLEKKTIYADGYNIEIEEWVHDQVSWYKISGAYDLPPGNMESFLARKGIRRIEVSEAIKLFQSEHDIATLEKARRESQNRMMAAYRDDVAEEGIAQANENWGQAWGLPAKDTLEKPDIYE